MNDIYQDFADVRQELDEDAELAVGAAELDARERAIADREARVNSNGQIGAAWSPFQTSATTAAPLVFGAPSNPYAFIRRQ